MYRTTNSFGASWLGLMACALLAASTPACTPAATTERGDEAEEAAVGTAGQALFANGNFESGTHNAAPPSWTVTSHLNPGVTIQSPQTKQGLNLQTGGSAKTFTYLTASGPETQWDPGLGSGSSLRWPKYGNGVGVVNFQGLNRNTNSLKQTMTITSGDIDPVDGKAHVRFTVAPVLEEPGHTAAQQPYYFVQLTNVTKSTILYRDYNASAQPGVPWKVSNGLYYTDWQLVDIAPGNASLAIGDQVELEVIAAGCSLSGHYGHVYVDGIGATVPGLFVSATGPSAANAGADITYTLTYTNGGTTDASNVALSLTTPPNTTYRAVSTGVGTCTAPSVGSTGTVSCQVGGLQAGASQSLTVTVRINAAATGTITNGNYAISATGATPLLGPKVYTSVTSGVTYADLAITKDNGVGGVAWGQPVTYTVVASNAGPSAVTGATVTDTLPAQLTGATWSCAGTGGATCAASGAGNIADTVSLPVGGVATYTLSANVVSGTGTGSVTNTATITAPGGVSDSAPSNNAAADTDPIGELRTLSFTKAGNGQGTVVSAPASISCGLACSSADGHFVNGTTVVLSANPFPTHTFAGWGGACSGTGTCTVVLSASVAVTATFTSPLADDGQSCGSGGECASGNCVDGLCCNTACDGSCAACDLPGSLGTCAPLAAGTSCRAAAGGCDVAESCDGTSELCPADELVAAGTECRASAGACDAAELCDGSSAACPEDARQSAGTVCRAAAGDCDVAEVCDGGSVACPEDVLVSSGVVCRDAAGVCDLAEQCSGSSAACPEDARQSAGTVCRAAAGDCDVAEVCDGGAVACPEDGFLASDVVCRDSAGACDVAETCSGAGATCPEDGFLASDVVCRDSAGACDVAETCTGAAATCPQDGFLAAGTECRAASCSMAVSTLAASCSGDAPRCPEESQASCGAYLCGADACLTSCAAKTDCGAGFFCDEGSCLPELEAGVACEQDGACASGSCVDGVCCDVACEGQCEACDVPGSVGTCVPVVGAPHGERPTCDGDGSACDGFCDGERVSACVYPGEATLCRAASCTDRVATLAATCDGAGSCPGEQTQSCDAYVCGATACLGDCVQKEDCSSGNFCNAGMCVPRRENGDSCSGSFQCASNSCVDGVCCDRVCDGQCESCGEPESLGTCVAVAGDPRGARPACASDGSLCGGSCDGVEAASCSYPSPAERCRDASCSDAVATLAAYCDGLGACPAETTQSCASYRCGETACLGDCSVDADCVGTHYCSGGICVEKADNGAVCAANGACKSGFCVDGVCCDSACTGQCEACDISEQEGICAATVGAPHGARPACASDASVCGGACDGMTTERCAYPGAERACREASCEAGVATMAAACDGQGACPARVDVACGDYTCGEDVCLGDCATHDDCSGGFYCAAGMCVEVLPLGQACSSDASCASGECVDGVCCDRACDGQCEACDTSGLCAPVAGAPRGGRTPCAGSGICGGTCDGTDPAACSYPDADVSCRDAVCYADVAAAPASCDGAGTCSAPEATSCEHGCEGDACAAPPAAAPEAPPAVGAAGGCAAGGGHAPKPTSPWVVLGGLLLLARRRRHAAVT